MREETGGGDVNYYVLDIQNPKRWDPCTVECEDVIAALGLNFFEGEAFKAIWRKGAQRTFGVGKAGNTALRDAEKMAHYGARELAHEQHRLTYATGGPIRGESTGVLGEKPSEYLVPGELQTVSFSVEQVLGFDPADPRQWMAGDSVVWLKESSHYYSQGEHYQVVKLSSTHVHLTDDKSDIGHPWGFTPAAESFRWVSRGVKVCDVPAAPPPGQWLPGDQVRGKSGLSYTFDGLNESGYAMLRNQGALPVANLTWVGRA